MQLKASKKKDGVNFNKEVTTWKTEEKTVNHKTSCEEDMELIDTTTTSEVFVGMGTNLYHQPTYRNADSPITKYRFSAYLKFPKTNTNLLVKICQFFGYDSRKNKNTKPEKGWLITDECSEYYLPEMFFYTVPEMIAFFREIQESIALKEVLYGTPIDDTNLNSMAWEAAYI